MTKYRIPRMCMADGCPNPYSVKKYCRKHYHKWKRHGDPLAPDPRRENAIVNQEQDFWAKVHIKGATECWEWTKARDRGGYGCYKKNGKMYKAHRWAYAYTHKTIPSQLILHSCDNPPCCNPNHLREGTYQDNRDDMVQRNRHPRGVTSGKSKVVERDVREIRYLFQAGMTFTEISDYFPLVPSTIASIVRRQTWKHVI